MSFKSLIPVLLLASARPLLAQPHGAAPRAGNTFEIQVENKCSAAQSLGVYGVTSAFQMIQHGASTTVPAGGSGTIHAPYTGIGLRLSNTADQGLAAQWNAQLLFEFGYTTYAGQTGTAYDISMMNADPTVGMSVTVLSNGQGSETCPSKTCTPESCPPDQGWTNADQTSLGSPADAVCYYGKTNFQVTYCP